MVSAPADQARVVLRVLADLSPAVDRRASDKTIPLEWFRWLPLDHVRILGDPFERQSEFAMRIDPDFGDRLAAIDQIRTTHAAIHVGWLWVAGRVPDERGRPQRVFHPLFTRPVRVARGVLPFGGRVLQRAGDPALTPFVTDQAARDRFSVLNLGGGGFDGMDGQVTPGFLHRFPTLHQDALAVARAAGFSPDRLVPAGPSPETLMDSDGVSIVVGVGIYTVEEHAPVSRAGSLQWWADQPLGRWTAFHSLYVDRPDPPPDPPATDSIESPYVLTAAQRDAVRSSREDPVTVVSGAPGTGKSHTVAAIACDALARGESILVAAKSEAAVDALLDLLEEVPGADPVVFGSSERRLALADRLAEGYRQAGNPAARDRTAEKLAASRVRRDDRRASIVSALRAETITADPHELDEARTFAPRLFGSVGVLDDFAEHLDAASQRPRGWWSRWRVRRAKRELRALAGIDDELNLDVARRCLDLARAAERSSELRAAGGLAIGPDWDELQDHEDEARQLMADWLAAEVRSPDRIDRAARRAVAALATALRSGRSARREQLTRMGDRSLLRAIPLWVGTLADVDDLLPASPSLFDVVVVDEASAVEQPLAASALLRADRAVIVGDPRQLRHVSFLSDERVHDVLRTHALDSDPLLMSRLDVRRNSLFDVAAGTAPVLVLDEHFRSSPHLFDFVARTLYDDHVFVATRSPATESLDCVHVERVDGHRDKDEVVVAEVDAVVARLQRLAREGRSSLGVVTPFRAQADALEAAILAAFTADQLIALDVRVGTVHGFQGNERDTVIVSLGIGPSESAASWTFAQEPRLFTVMMTRAREELVLLMSCDAPAGGLLDRYLAQADSPPPRPEGAAAANGWSQAIADDLRTAGLPVTANYPVGRHHVDLCVGDRTSFYALECGVHPDGPEAHVDRHLALRRLGWNLRDAYPSRWADRRAELVVGLTSSTSAAQ